MFRVYVFKEPLKIKNYSEPVIINNDVRSSFSPEDMEKIEIYWKEVVKPKYNHFRRDIPIANLTGIAYDEDKNHLQEIFNITYYDVFVAARNSDLTPPNAGLSDEALKKINPRAFSVITETEDDKIVMGYREANVLAAGKRTPLPQGVVVLRNPNAFDTVLKGLERELGIKPDYVKDMEMIAYVDHSDYPDISSSFRVSLNLTSKEIEELVNAERISRGFNKDLHFMDAEKNEVIKFIKNYRNTTGDSAGNMLAYLKHRFDGNVFDNVVRDLNQEIGRVLVDLKELCEMRGITYHKVKG